MAGTAFDDDAEKVERISGRAAQLLAEALRAFGGGQGYSKDSVAIMRLPAEDYDGIVVDFTRYATANRFAQQLSKLGLVTVEVIRVEPYGARSGYVALRLWTWANEAAKIADGLEHSFTGRHRVAKQDNIVAALRTLAAGKRKYDTNGVLIYVDRGVIHLTISCRPNSGNKLFGALESITRGRRSRNVEHVGLQQFPETAGEPAMAEVSITFTSPLKLRDL